MNNVKRGITMEDYWFDSKKVLSWEGYLFFIILLGLEILLGFLFNFSNPKSTDVLGFLFSLTALFLIALYIARKKTKNKEKTK